MLREGKEAVKVSSYTRFALQFRVQALACVLVADRQPKG
jgi:hypothetical protein